MNRNLKDSWQKKRIPSINQGREYIAVNMEQRGKIMREHVKLNMSNAEQQQHEHAHDVTKPLLLGRGGGGGGVHDDDGCGQEVDITYHIDPVVCVCALYKV